MTSSERERERVRVGVAPIVEKMVETQHRRFGHVERRHVDFIVKKHIRYRVVESLETIQDLEKL